jgi:hypothetical protein
MGYVMGRENFSSEIFAVKALRAFNDPILSYEPGYVPDENTFFRQVVPLERMQLVIESEDTERVELASWAETAIYCSTASLVNQAWARGEAAKIYKYAFREVLDEWGDNMLSEGSRQSVGLDTLELSDHEKRKASKLRRKLKRKRDKLFLENAYDDLGLQAPKAVWKGGPQVGKVEDVIEA